MQNILNFTCLTIKFHNCHHANVSASEAAPHALTPFILALTLPLWVSKNQTGAHTHKVAINANKTKFRILAYLVQGRFVFEQ